MFKEATGLLAIIGTLYAHTDTHTDTDTHTQTHTRNTQCLFGSKYAQMIHCNIKRSNGIWKQSIVALQPAGQIHTHTHTQTHTHTHTHTHTNTNTYILCLVALKNMSK